MMFTESADTTEGDWAQYGCYEHVDYTGSDINPSVFLSILSGDAENVKKLTGKENPKVLSAGPNDTVFTYFIDHGELSMIMVGSSVVLNYQLLEAIETAHEKGLYGKWVWFMEACYSGSMFDSLPSNIGVYAMTSADDEHVAKMSECPPNDYVAGESLGTCLAGLWDNVWLDYVEAHPDCTIGEVVDATMADVKETSSQNVCEWGDKSFRDLKLSEFFGEMPAPALRRTKKEAEGIVSLDEVPLHLAKWAAIRSTSDKEEALKAYQQEVVNEAKREVEVMRLGRILLNEKAVVAAMNTPSESYSTSCVRDLSIQLMEKCGHSLPFSHSVSNLLRNICLPGINAPNVNWNDVCL